MRKTQQILLVALVLVCTVAFVACDLAAKKAQMLNSLKHKHQRNFLARKSAQTDKQLSDGLTVDAKRIVGGTPTTPGQYPWLASLRVRGDGVRFYRHFCGGSLIGDRVIYTAAHCSFLASGAVEVGLGEHDLNAAFEVGSEVHRVKNIIVHPRYDEDMRFDIALWILETKSSITPATVVSRDQNLAYPGAMASIAGWGTTSFGGEPSPVLLQATVPIVDKQQCADVYQSYPWESMLCAGYASGGIDTCQGDSGGPIFFMVDGSPVIVGDTSFGNGCAEPNIPGIYGNGKVALPFVEAVTKGIRYLSIKTVNIVQDYMSDSLLISTQAFDLGRNVAVEGASVTISLTVELATGATTTTYSSGETAFSGVYGFSKMSKGAGTYKACVTELSAPGYDNIDLSESCNVFVL